jgi:hypothetical protein
VLMRQHRSKRDEVKQENGENCITSFIKFFHSCLGALRIKGVVYAACKG